MDGIKGTSMNMISRKLLSNTTASVVAGFYFSNNEEHYLSKVFFAVIEKMKVMATHAVIV